MCMLCRSLFVILYGFILAIVFFVDIRILITPLVSSNSSYKKQEVLNLFDSPAGFHLFKFSVLWCVFVFCLSSLCVLCIQY